MAEPRDPGAPFVDGPMKWDELCKDLGEADAPERVDGPKPADEPSSGGGNRHIAPNPDDKSDFEQLEALVGQNQFWEMVEAQTAFVNDNSPKGPRPGRPQKYVPADIVVVETCTHHYGNAARAIRNLKDPKTWKRLRKTAKKAFPHDKDRRLSKRAPNRWQIYRGKAKYFSGEALKQWQRLLRRHCLEGARTIGCFDPAAGTWTHPDSTQCIAGDSSWVRSATQHDRSVLLDPNNKVIRFDPAAYHHHYRNKQPTKVPGREVVMLSCRTKFGNERIVVDFDFMPHKRHHSRRDRTDADFAIDMLADLIDEHPDLLKGLRAFIYDMAMDSEGIDNVLALGAIPIVKTQKLGGGKHRHGNIGPHPFICRDGKIRELEIKTVNGSTCVKLPNAQGTTMAIPLERAHFRWGDETKDGNNTAYLKVRIPHDSGAPGRFKGATATVRLNSTAQEIHTSPHTRRTRSLRPIPEADPAFKLHGGREDIESTFADLKYRIRWKLCSHMEDRFRFNISCYQLLRLSRTLSAFNSRSP